MLAPVWAKESGAGVEVLGAMFAAFSGASVLGALAAARWGETLPRYRTYVVAFLVAGAPRFVVMALESPLWAVFAVTVVAGAASGFLNPILGAVILERIPAPLMGRVSSLNTAICWSLMPLGGVLGGLAVTAARRLAGPADRRRGVPRHDDGADAGAVVPGDGPGPAGESPPRRGLRHRVTVATVTQCRTRRHSPTEPDRGDPSRLSAGTSAPAPAPGRWPRARRS